MHMGLFRIMMHGGNPVEWPPQVFFDPRHEHFGIGLEGDILDVLRQTDAKAKLVRIGLHPLGKADDIGRAVALAKQRRVRAVPAFALRQILRQRLLYPALSHELLLRPRHDIARHDHGLRARGRRGSAPKEGGPHGTQLPEIPGEALALLLLASKPQVDTEIVRGRHTLLPRPEGRGYRPQLGNRRG